MKLTARNDQVMIKSQSKPNFASGKYGHWQNTASWEESEVRALGTVSYLSYPSEKQSLFGQD